MLTSSHHHFATQPDRTTSAIGFPSVPSMGFVIPSVCLALLFPCFAPKKYPIIWCLFKRFLLRSLCSQAMANYWLHWRVNEKGGKRQFSTLVVWFPSVQLHGNLSSEMAYTSILFALLVSPTAFTGVLERNECTVLSMLLNLISHFLFSFCILFIACTHLRFVRINKSAFHSDGKPTKRVLNRL